MKTLSRIKKGLFFVLTLVIIFSCSVLFVRADTFEDNKGISHEIAGKYINPWSQYIVSETVEEIDLEYGLQYRFDKGFVNTTDEKEITADMNAAGGGAYASSGKMKANTYYPADVRVFEVSPDLGVQIVPWVKFKQSNWSLNSVLAMAEDYEKSHPGFKVIGAINGDYFDISSKQNYNYCSTGATVSEGNNYKLVDDWNQIGFKDGTLKGNLRGVVSEKQTIEVFDKNGKVIYSGLCDKLNDEPGENETALFVAFWDESHKAMSYDIDNAYIIKADKFVPFSKKSVYGIGSLLTDTSATLGKQNFAIKTNVQALKDVLKGEVTVRVQNTYENELADFDYVIGYPNNVLLNSECVASGDYRHPRTSIGVKADGTIVMAEIDGRQANIDCYGCTLKEEAALMAYYGCVDAFNLDGGGSSTICILEDGKLTVQNSTSDGSPRSDGNCLLIVAEVPIMELKASDVKETEFSVSLTVTKMIETYKDLYIYSDADNEYRKIISGDKVTYTSLNNNTKYGYSLYSKVNDKYLKIPFSGAVYTAKLKFELTDLQINFTNGGEGYEVLYDISDPQTTLINVVLIVNGKRHYPSDNRFKVLAETGCPIGDSAELQITYNRNDLNGQVTDKLVMSAKINDPTIIMDGCISNVGSMLDNLYK